MKTIKLTFMKKLLITLSLGLAACSPGFKSIELLPPVGEVLPDHSIIRGRALFVVSSDQYRFTWLDLFLPHVYAATGSTNVAYVNAAAVNFSINNTNFVAGAFTGETLSLGSVSLASLSDNNLKICGVGGNQKCTSAIIRVYTTGSVAGFVHTDGYGAPVFAGLLNPNSPVGLNTAGSVQVQTYTIPANKNKVKLSDFPSPTYSVTSDFSNAGSGNYSMVFVVEYVLQ